MKIAAFNLDGVNGPLEALLRWLAEAAPDAVCPKALKAPQATFARGAGGRRIRRALGGAPR